MKRSSIQKLAHQIAKGATSPLERVKAVHDWIILNTAYDYENYLKNTIPAVCYRATAVFENGVAVCSGYASAAEALLDALGVKVIVVSNSTHAWNMVWLDGAWYHLDVTWDDPVPDVPGRVVYTYFLISTKKIAKTRELPYSFPDAPNDYPLPFDRRVPAKGRASRGLLRRPWFRLRAAVTSETLTVRAKGEGATRHLDRDTVRLIFTRLRDRAGIPLHKYFSRSKPLLTFGWSASEGWTVSGSASGTNRLIVGGELVGGEPRVLKLFDRLEVRSARQGRTLDECALIVCEN